MPDGTYLEVDFLDDAETTTVGTDYTFATVYVPQTAGTIAVRSGTASLMLPAGNPNVPLFGRNGGIMVSAVDSLGNVITVLSCTYANLGSTTSQP